ncbi:MAG: FlgD immunoglobulin-like domain containing protein [Candidatus Zixiibacteriota bacterium]
MTKKTVHFVYMLIVILGLTSISALAGQGDALSVQEFRNALHFTPPEANQAVASIPALPAIKSTDGITDFALDFDDLLLSETIGPANFTQQKGDITALKNGRYAAVWEDNRLGATGVFVQLFDRLTAKIGVNEALITANNYNLSDPKICADTAGNFYVVWREEVNGFLQAARFDSTGAVLTDVFYVSDTIYSTYAGEFSATALHDGRLVVAWENYSIGNDIAFRIINTNGTPSTAMLSANSDGPMTKHWSPAIASGANSDFAIIWEDYRNGIADIFFRRFNPGGSAYAPEFSISDASAQSSARYMPALTYSAPDGYVAAWVDMRDGENIYMERVSPDSGAVDANILVSDEFTEDANWEIDLSANSAGVVAAVWTVYGDYNTIQMVRYASGLVKNGSAMTISTATQKPRFTPAVAVNENSRLITIWTDLISGSIDIFMSTHDANGSILTVTQVLNDDTEGSPSFEPAVVSYDRFEWNIVFTDKRYDAGDIMFQRVYVGGELIGVNRKINQDAVGGTQSEPAIATGNDVLLISWTDIRSNGVNGQNIICRYSVPSTDITDEIVVNDDASGSAAHYNSDCAINSAGNALIVWTDTRQGSAKIYGQLFNADRNKVGGNFLIGPSATANIGQFSTVAVNSSGNFVVSYLNRLASGGPAVEVKQVSTTGTVSDMFAFQSDQSGYAIDGFDAGLNSGNTFYLVWHAFSGDGPQIFLTLLNSSGGIVNATQVITDDVNAYPGMPTMTVDSDDYLLVTWPDNRTGITTPYRQIYESSLTPIQANTPTTSVGAPYMQTPVGAGMRGRGVFVWADARSNGLNIYASQYLYAPTDVDDDNVLPTTFALSQNVPNPFNPTTMISFSIPQGGHVSLEILNVLGQRVRHLVDGDYPAGTHEVIWDGTDSHGNPAATGIYFYRISSNEFTSTRKMLLVK